MLTAVPVLFMTFDGAMKVARAQPVLDSCVQLGPSHTLFPTYVGALLWGGLFLRDARVRALLASRS